MVGKLMDWTKLSNFRLAGDHRPSLYWFLGLSVDVHKATLHFHDTLSENL